MQALKLMADVPAIRHLLVCPTDVHRASSTTHACHRLRHLPRRTVTAFNCVVVTTYIYVSLKAVSICLCKSTANYPKNTHKTHETCKVTLYARRKGSLRKYPNAKKNPGHHCVCPGFPYLCADPAASVVSHRFAMLRVAYFLTTLKVLPSAVRTMLMPFWRPLTLAPFTVKNSAPSRLIFSALAEEMPVVGSSPNCSVVSYMSA